MSNQALPADSRRLLERYLNECRNLGLILDKYAPWGMQERGGWDLVMVQEQRRRGQTELRSASGGQAKGLWLKTTRRAKRGESPSLFEVDRLDMELLNAQRERLQRLVEARHGLLFSLRTAERLVVGLGASHVLETAISLDRNTGIPVIPGSSLKGLARTRGLFELASLLGIEFGQEFYDEAEVDPGRRRKTALIKLNELLNEAEPVANAEHPREIILNKLKQTGADVSRKDAAYFIDWLRFVFGTVNVAGAVAFPQAMYAGDDPMPYIADVMTPHYFEYYSTSGQGAPAENDDPQPVTFLTVDRGMPFWFGLLPRTHDAEQKKAHEVAYSWLVSGLVELGAGGKTAAGYGYFNGKSLEEIVK